MSLDFDFDAQVLAEASLLDLERARKPALFDFLVPLSLAARAELELVRAMRQKLFPAAESGLEADLWASPVLQAADLGAVVLLPDVRAELHEFLARDQDLLEEAWKIVRHHHENLDAVILLEERTIYHTLRGDLAEAQVELGTILNALQSGTSDPQLLRWTSRFLNRLPTQTKDTGAAIELADEFARQTGSDHPAGFSKPAPDRSATVTLGVRRVPQGVWITCPPEGNAKPLEVPRTDPVKLFLASPTAEGWEETTVEVPDSAIARSDSPGDSDEESVEPFHHFVDYPAHDFGRELLMKVADAPVSKEDAPDFEYDVYLSYASIDNEPLDPEDERSRWVSTFRETLQASLSQRLGRKVRIWMDQELRGSEDPSEEILEGLRKSATFLALVSPASLKSEWVQQELRTFLKYVDLEEARLFPVHLEDIPREDLPEPLRLMVGYRFFEETKSGGTRRFGQPVPTPDDREYFNRLNGLAWDLLEKIRSLSEPPAAGSAQSDHDSQDPDPFAIHPGQVRLRTVEQRQARLRFASENPLLHLLLDPSLDSLPAPHLDQFEDLGWRWELAPVGTPHTGPVVWFSTPNDDYESDQDVIDVLERLDFEIIRSPSGGGDFPERTPEQIARSHAAVVLFDEHSFDQDWFLKEFARLLKRREVDREFALIAVATTGKAMDRLAKHPLHDRILIETYPVSFGPRKHQLSQMRKGLSRIAKGHRSSGATRIGNEESAATALVFSDSLSLPEIAARLADQDYTRSPELKHALQREQPILLARVNRKGEGSFAIFGIENPSASDNDALMQAFAASLHRARFDDPKSDHHMGSFRRALLTLEQSTERRRIQQFLENRFQVTDGERAIIEDARILIGDQSAFMVTEDLALVWTRPFASKLEASAIAKSSSGKRSMRATLLRADEDLQLAVYRIENSPSNLPFLPIDESPVELEDRWSGILFTGPADEGLPVAGVIQAPPSEDNAQTPISVRLRIRGERDNFNYEHVFGPVVRDGKLVGLLARTEQKNTGQEVDLTSHADLAYARDTRQILQLLNPPPRLELVAWKDYRPGDTWAPPNPDFFAQDPDPSASATSGTGATRWGVATPDGTQFHLLYERQTAEPSEDPAWKPLRLFPPNDCTSLLQGWLKGESDTIESRLHSGWELGSAHEEALGEFIESIMEPPGPLVPGLRWRIAGYEPGDKNPENPDGHAGTPRSLAMSPSGAFGLTAANSGPDQTVRLWYLPTGKLEGSLENQAASGGHTAVALAEDGARFLTSYAHDLRLWDAASGKQLAEWPLKLSNAEIVDAAFAGDNYVVAATGDQAVLIEIDSGKTTPIQGAGNYLAVAATEKGDLLALLNEKSLSVFRTHSGSFEMVFIHDAVGNLKNNHLIFQRPPLRFTPEEQLIFGSPQAIWSRDSGVSFNERQQLANVADYSWDGTAVWATSPGSIQIVDRNGEHLTPELMCGGREISCVAISADGSTVLAADLDHHLWVWWLGRRSDEQAYEGFNGQ